MEMAVLLLMRHLHIPAKDIYDLSVNQFRLYLDNLFELLKLENGTNEDTENMTANELREYYKRRGL